MKRFFFFLLITVGAVFAQVNDRTEHKLVFADSISNSQAKTFYVDLRNTESYDSVGVAILQYGAVSVDSVINWAPGIIDNIPNRNFGSLRISKFNTGGNIALANDQTTTGTNAAYAVATTRLTKANLLSFPNLSLTITALGSGNTASATAQRVAVYLILYR